MSSDESLDPRLIEQTKQQIRTLVAEIAQISHSEMAPQEFYGEFLTRVVAALAANGGVVWATEDGGGGPLSLQYQINLQDTRLREAAEEDQIRHGRLLQKVMTTGEGLVVQPRSGPGDDQEAGNPTDFLLVLAALKTDVQVLGVVEVFQRPEAGPQTQMGYLRFLLQMCQHAGDFLRKIQIRSFSDRQALWTQLEDFTRAVHASLEPRATAYTIANEGRRLIECDRVSVALRRGRRCAIEAISGQDLFDKRSNTVRLLGDLATAVVASEEPMWYTGDTSNMAPQVEEAVQAYVDESHSKTVAVIPLRRPEAAEEKEPDEHRETLQPVGALIVEQIEDVRVAPKMVQRVDVVAQHSSVAMANAMEHQNLFLMPLWRAIGKSRWIVQARTLPKTISIGAAVLVALLCLILVPADFKLHCKGTLEPVERRDLHANVENSIVDDVFVKHGEPVVPYDPGTDPWPPVNPEDRNAPKKLLARLRSTELAIAIEKAQGEYNATQAQFNSIQRLATDDKRLTAEERSRLHGQRFELQQRLESLRGQLKLYEQKQKDLVVTSPIKGVVVTWDLNNRLPKGRPVQRGQVLMRIADPESEKGWQLELQMPEDRMGYLVKWQNETGEDLQVRYILATDPGTEHTGTIKEMHYSAEVHGEEGNTVLIKVTIDRNDLKDEHVRPGATVSAKVYCGRRPVGFVWFHDLVAFFQSRVLFRFF